MKRLKFANGNAKLGKHVATFSLPAGYSCPGALECLSKANKKTGKITDGKETVFRCFSATSEALFPNVRQSRWVNFDLLKKCKTVEAMRDLILASLPKKFTHVRIHVSGDFFNQMYFDAWIKVAQLLPEKTFYFYTKNIPVWLERIALVGNGHVPGTVKNIVPTASLGSRFDSLIREYNLRTAKVVYSAEEAERHNMEIDHDDFHAQNFGADFALLIHGIQPKGSKAQKAKVALKGVGTYGRGSKKISLTVV